MPHIPIVENPRRRRHRRKLSPAQLAAGFGGKRYRHRRRRNPGLMALSNPRRRRRSVYAAPRRHRRRYRNPGMLSGITGGMKGLFDVKTGLYVGAGILSTTIGPRLVAKVWPGVPTTGIGGFAVKLGCVFVASTAVKMITKSSQGASQVMAGGLGAVVVELANEYLLPKLGLSGYDDLTTAEAEEILLNGYQAAPGQIAGVGAYQQYDPAYAG